MREVTHLGDAALPPPMHSVGVRELPWMRRERVDAYARRCLGDLLALVVEDPEYAEDYEIMAVRFRAAIDRLDEIEDASA